MRQIEWALWANEQALLSLAGETFYVISKY